MVKLPGSVLLSPALRTSPWLCACCPGSVLLSPDLCPPPQLCACLLSSLLISPALYSSPQLCVGLLSSVCVSPLHVHLLDSLQKPTIACAVKTSCHEFVHIGAHYVASLYSFMSKRWGRHGPRLTLLCHIHSPSREQHNPHQHLGEWQDRHFDVHTETRYNDLFKTTGYVTQIPVMKTSTFCKHIKQINGSQFLCIFQN